MPDREYHKIEWRACGHTIPQTRWGNTTTRPFRPSEIRELARNPHLAHHINTLMPQVFPGPPQVHVVDQDGNEPIPELSRALGDSMMDCGLYESMRRAYVDCMLYGCAIRSVAVSAMEAPYIRVAEIRDLPAASFGSAPLIAGRNVITPNSLMPGLVMDNGKPRAYQTNPYNGSVEEVENWDVICDPATPQPYGEAYCLPIYSILESIAIAEAALDAAVYRRGTPLLTLKIKDDLPPAFADRVDDIVDTAAEFVDSWGTQSGAVLPQGVEVPPITTGIIDGSDAHERLLDLDALLDSFFSPASALAPGRSDKNALFGASQASRARIWRAHVAGQQAWIEREFEAIFEGVGLLDANLCPDDWRIEIRLERPAEEDIHARKLQELQIAISAGVISAQEIRDHLDVLDLAAEMPADVLQRPAMPVANTDATATVKLPLQEDAPEPSPEAEKQADKQQAAADAQDDAVAKVIAARQKVWQDRMAKWIIAQRAIYAKTKL